MKTRTYGWVQNPSSFANLKKVVKIFDSNSDHYSDLRDNLLQNIYFDDIRKELLDKLNKSEVVFSYTELVGTSKNKEGKSPKKRSDAVADALIQISILPQGFKRTGKTWTDNWTADGFLRWAVSLNFVSVNREEDTFSITTEGKRYVQTVDSSTEEKKVLREALLAYPPATQILHLLEENGEYCTKFYLGEYLGFRGERGFTSYDEELMFDWLEDADDTEKKKIKSDVEGSSDKYARQICNWLKNVGLVDSQTVKRKFSSGKTDGFQGYKINGRGSHALRQADGSSKNYKHKKFLMWEFFATNCENRDYVRTRRAYIVKFLQETTSLSKLVDRLRQKGFNDEIEVIKSDIQGLIYFGLRIDVYEDKVVLKDSISDFTIPDLVITKELRNEKFEQRRAKFLKITNLPMKYIELLEIAFDGARNRDFEILTMDLFRNIYKLPSKLLGGGRKPDGLVYTDKFGIIIDTKAYGEGYSKSINQADEMIRYIEDNKRRDVNRNPIEWWKEYPSSISNDSFYFLWISSQFVGKFQEQLDYTANETQTTGGALNVEQLLIGADLVAKGEFSSNELYSLFKNEEIIFKEV
ncbi:restriction endonuclease FokI C-terminal domain-containing protein [Streptococcus periodonticum]|uniref:restriction endonuclease FokI C-terminal domain-containing protein n=1 Tax=Streptococcus periodonticum TaxID=2490633 RepID=UPI00157F8597|nr:restriction endonuclease FokI C-terminal domain-containing protein [Streptococcus periodonticum]